MQSSINAEIEMMVAYKQYYQTSADLENSRRLYTKKKVSRHNMFDISMKLQHLYIQRYIIAQNKYLQYKSQ
jgi:hypothetical protein